MNNTPYDDELDKIFPCDCAFNKGFAFKKGDPCDGSCVLASYKARVKQLLQSQTLEAEKRERLLRSIIWESIGENIAQDDGRFGSTARMIMNDYINNQKARANGALAALDELNNQKKGK